MCARSMHKAVEGLTSDFMARSGHDVALECGTVGSVQAKIASGESADVIILAVPAINNLEKSGVLVPGSCADVAVAFIAVCVRAGAPRPDIMTAEAFERTLRSARAIAL